MTSARMLLIGVGTKSTPPRTLDLGERVTIDRVVSQFGGPGRRGCRGDRWAVADEGQRIGPEQLARDCRAARPGRGLPGERWAPPDVNGAEWEGEA